MVHVNYNPSCRSASVAAQDTESTVTLTVKGRVRVRVRVRVTVTVTVTVRVTVAVRVRVRVAVRMSHVVFADDPRFVPCAIQDVGQAGDIPVGLEVARRLVQPIHAILMGRQAGQNGGPRW